MPSWPLTLKKNRQSTVTQLGAQLGLPFAPAAGQPLAAEVANLPRGRKLREFGESASQNRAAAFPLLGRAEGPADGMIHEGSPRRSHFAHDVVSGPDDQGGDASTLDHVCDETNGLMTEGSIGNQEGEIHAALRDLVGEGRSKLVFDLCVRAHPAHERIVKRRQRADHILLG